MTPSHGQLPHAPVAGSQQEPSVHGLVGSHWFVTQVGVAAVVSQTWPDPQGGSHAGRHAPSLHAWSSGQVTPAHEPTHVNEVKSALGLHTSSGGHESSVHGLSVHEPSLQTLPQPWHGAL